MSLNISFRAPGKLECTCECTCGKIYESTHEKMKLLHELLSDLERIFLGTFCLVRAMLVKAYLIFGKGGWACEIFIKLNHDAPNGQRTTLTNTPAYPNPFPLRIHTSRDLRGL